MRTGLALGKFAPLHRGHQELIETALSEVDQLIILIYDAPETRIPLAVRAGWIRALYPHAEVIEAWDGPTEVGDSPEIREAHEAYLRRILAGRCIDAFYSGEFYGDHVSRALGAADRRVERLEAALSATAIRRDPYARRRDLDPLVYRDHVALVALVGAPSTGKTTLAEALAAAYETCWMPEFGREYWEAHQVGRRLTPLQLVEIARGHIAREEELIGGARDYLFSDTNALTTALFARYYHGSVAAELEGIARTAEKRYDLVFLCGDEIPYDDTWDRSGELNRSWFQRQIEGDLRTRRVPFITLQGTVAERVAAVKSVLAYKRKYDNFYDISETQSNKEPL